MGHYMILLDLADVHKLQEELDDALGSEDEYVSTYEQVKRLTYLEAVINEVLRVHLTSSLDFLA
ncbi:hypothetical protein EDB19DRAFT_1759330 [Suillus lakei]|nr:hypothetical protein EDB19DRAFT_1759330 [Suillus lakei]